MHQRACRAPSRALCSLVFLLAAACGDDTRRAADAGSDEPSSDAESEPEEEEEDGPFDAGRVATVDPCAQRACRVRWLRGLGSDLNHPRLALGAARFAEDGSLVVAGSAVAGGVLGSAPFLQLRGSPDYGAMDAFTLTFSASGAPSPASVFGQALGDGVHDMALADDGDRVIVGYTGVVSSSSGAGSDVEVVRMSASGELRWRKGFGSTRVTCNNCADESAQRVLLGPDGSSYVFGTLNAPTQLDALQLAGQGFALALSKTGAAQWTLPLAGRAEQVLLWQDHLYVASVDYDRTLERDQLTLSKIALDGKLLWQTPWSGADPTLLRLDVLGLEIDQVSERPLLFATELIYGNSTEYGKTHAIGFDPETGVGAARELWSDRFFHITRMLLLDDGEWLALGRDSDGKSWKVALQFWSPRFVRMHELRVGDDRAHVELVNASVSRDGAIAVFGSVRSNTVREPAPIFSAGGSAVQARDLSFVFMLER